MQRIQLGNMHSQSAHLSGCIPLMFCVLDFFLGIRALVCILFIG